MPFDGFDPLLSDNLASLPFAGCDPPLAGRLLPNVQMRLAGLTHPLDFHVAWPEPMIRANARSMSLPLSCPGRCDAGLAIVCHTHISTNRYITTSTRPAEPMATAMTWPCERPKSIGCGRLVKMTVSGCRGVRGLLVHRLAAFGFVMQCVGKWSDLPPVSWKMDESKSNMNETNVDRGTTRSAVVSKIICF